MKENRLLDLKFVLCNKGLFLDIEIILIIYIHCVWLIFTFHVLFNNSTDASLLDAACNGAMQATSIILGVIANIIAFVAFVAFLNGTVGKSFDID